jgi:methyl-accepting chemotaxis protein
MARSPCRECLIRESRSAAVHEDFFDEIGTFHPSVRSLTQSHSGWRRSFGPRVTIGTPGYIASAFAAAVEQQHAAAQEIAANVQQAAIGTQEISRNIEWGSRAAATTSDAASTSLGASDHQHAQASTFGETLRGLLAQLRAA